MCAVDLMISAVGLLDKANGYRDLSTARWMNQYGQHTLGFVQSV